MLCICLTSIYATQALLQTSELMEMSIAECKCTQHICIFAFALLMEKY